MLLTILYMFVLCFLLKQTCAVERKILVVISMIIYLIFTYCDLFYLEYFCHQSFHPSDPTVYYDNSVNIGFRDIFSLESSNSFYYIINWFYNHIYDSSTFISLLIKTNNVFVILIAYLLVTRFKKNIHDMDYIL
ncbi:hypothetical protein, partial [uncultured Bacteroides sp.]|uniref:hypothetical protein n=1 Tax=uncultured Bacteroides sp. TaxID=162156 RepID=UPI002607642E